MAQNHDGKNYDVKTARPFDMDAKRERAEEVVAALRDLRDKIPELPPVTFIHTATGFAASVGGHCLDFIGSDASEGVGMIWYDESGNRMLLPVNSLEEYGAAVMQVQPSG